MIKDLKLGIRSLAFGHGVKGTCVIYVLMLIASGLLVVMRREEAGMGVLGSYLLLVSSLFPVQLLYSLSASDMLQASPAKRRMQTSIPVAINVCCVMLNYLLYALMRGIMAAGEGGMDDELCNEMLMAALMGMVIMAYSSIAYKCFVAATILFFMTYIVGINFVRLGGLIPVSWVLGSGRPLGSFLLAVAAGAVLIIIGGLLEYLLSLLVYKMPISRLALPASLRREL